MSRNTFSAAVLATQDDDVLERIDQQACALTCEALAIAPSELDRELRDDANVRTFRFECRVQLLCELLVEQRKQAQKLGLIREVVREWLTNTGHASSTAAIEAVAKITGGTEEHANAG